MEAAQAVIARERPLGDREERLPLAGVLAEFEDVAVTVRFDDRDDVAGARLNALVRV